MRFLNPMDLARLQRDAFFRYLLRSFGYILDQYDVRCDLVHPPDRRGVDLRGVDLPTLVGGAYRHLVGLVDRRSSIPARPSSTLRGMIGQLNRAFSTLDRSSFSRGNCLAASQVDRVGRVTLCNYISIYGQQKHSAIREVLGSSSMGLMARYAMMHVELRLLVLQLEEGHLHPADLERQSCIFCTASFASISGLALIPGSHRRALRWYVFPGQLLADPTARRRMLGGPVGRALDAATPHLMRLFMQELFLLHDRTVNPPRPTSSLRLLPVPPSSGRKRPSSDSKSSSSGPRVAKRPYTPSASPGRLMVPLGAPGLLTTTTTTTTTTTVARPTPTRGVPPAPASRAPTMRPLCPGCRRPMVEREGPFGPFWGCQQYPRCRRTRSFR
ncbi:MAG: topoisomerase DNA-binding C4 zinc finger domain-containing protein [Acidobacteriota bacterium]